MKFSVTWLLFLVVGLCVDSVVSVNHVVKRQANGCRGWMQRCSVLRAYPCCSGLTCVYQRCRWYANTQERIDSARQYTDSLGMPWLSNYQWGMRFHPLLDGAGNPQSWEGKK